MKTRSMLLNGAALLCLATACSPSSSESNEPLLSQQSDFYNLINVKNVPTQPRNPYVMLNLFADLGSSQKDHQFLQIMLHLIFDVPLCNGHHPH